MPKYCLILIFFMLLSCGVAKKNTDSSISNSQNPFNEGLRCYYQEDYPEAEKFFTIASRTQSDNDANWLYLSKLAQKRGNIKEALQYTEKALAIDPDNYWYLLRRAQICVALDQMPVATRCYEELWMKNRSKGDLLYEMINLFADRGDYKRSLALMDTLETRFGVSEQSVLARVGMLFAQADYITAVDTLESFVSHTPSARAFSILGDYYVSQGKEEDAMQAYKSAIEADDTFTPARFGMAEYYRLHKQYDLFFENAGIMLADANMDSGTKTRYLSQLLEVPRFAGMFLPQIDTLYMKMRSAHPCDSSSAYGYANFLAQSARMEDARKVLVQNVKCYPRDYYAWSQVLGLDYYLHQWDSLCSSGAGATKVFKLDGSAQSNEIYSLYGIGLWQSGHLESARDIFTSILPLLSKKDTTMQVQTLSCIGDIDHQMGNDKSAFAYYDKILRYDPHNTTILNNYAYYLCLRNEQLEKALKMSQEAIDQEPTNSTFLDTYGWILYTMREYKKAKDIFRQCMAYGGKESAEVTNHYGDVLHALGEVAMASVYWEQALELAPEREDIKAKIDAYKKGLK